jgi:hypothetical protein
MSLMRLVICKANQANGFELSWSVEIANQKAAWYTFMGKFSSLSFP